MTKMAYKGPKKSPSYRKQIEMIINNASGLFILQGYYITHDFNISNVFSHS